MEATLDKMEVAFRELVKENDAGRITVTRSATSLVISVKRKGDYTFSSDSGS